MENSEKLCIFANVNNNFNNMTRTLNISLNVPDSIGIEELTRQLTEYGERLIAPHREAATALQRHSMHCLHSLSMRKGKTDKELVDEYLTEKYGL